MGWQCRYLGGAAQPSRDRERPGAGPAFAQKLDDDKTLKTRRLLLASEKLGLTAEIDILEAADGEVTPVDIKTGKRPHVAEGAYLPERVQVCVQGLLLRDAGYRCEEGALFFAASRERVRVVFDEELVATSLRAASELRLTIASGRLPPPLDHSSKCPRCSLLPICLPDEVNWFKSAAIPRTPPPAATPALPLYVQKPGARITKKDFTLVIQSEDAEDQAIPFDEVSELILAGPVSLTTPAVHELLRRETPVAWMSSGFWFLGSTGGQGPRSAMIRTAQYAFAHDKPRSHAFARELVAAKIKNQRTILRRNWRGHEEDRAPLLERLSLLIERAARSEAMAQLLGFEGEAAALYFRAFPKLFTEKVGCLPEFSFENRNRRPPADPVMLVFHCVMRFLPARSRPRLRQLDWIHGKGFITSNGRAGLRSHWTSSSRFGPFSPIRPYSWHSTMANWRPMILSLPLAAATSRANLGRL